MEKRAIIIGASSGIGLATALQLQEEGWRVTNIARTATVGIDTVLADASQSGSIAAAIEQAAGGQPIDALVYSAGCSMACPIEYAEQADYRYLFEVNFFGALEAISAAIPLLKPSHFVADDGVLADYPSGTRPRGGRIVLVGSMGGTFPIAFDAFYSASKAALDMAARAVAVELKPYNIAVTSVRPGGVRTDFTFKRNIYGTAAVREYADRQQRAVASLAAMEQGGTLPEDVAKVISSVISAENPPVLVTVGLKNKAASVAAKVLPTRVVEYFNSTMYE